MAVICQHFLNGKCNRGTKCKFSHAAPSGSASSTKRKRPGAQFRERQMIEQGASGGEPEAGAVTAVAADAPRCTHGEKCMQRVGKNRNEGRIYWTCARIGSGEYKKCSFFIWEDRRGKGRDTEVGVEVEGETGGKKARKEKKAKKNKEKKIEKQDPVEVEVIR
ncbi:hypothetical protein TrST_g10565 [Triparma strigata]|uniref:C3H1-type domain-containing protein n=1 Tax=Triparma strigata TaxID=1606541 RepID=A0A9W7AT59_9STRA|nr:hypothetical protein TrST_g10565 [Triparma strigata]